MPAPIPVLRDAMSVVSAHDLEFIMRKLDRSTLEELFASLGIAVQGVTDEILRYSAFSSPWDYARTKKLREFFALSFDSNHLTGFLIEAPMNYSFEGLYSLLNREKQRNRRNTQKDDDLRGIIDVTPANNILECRYKFTHERIKSDLSMFRDEAVDTRFFVYNTGRICNVNRPLFCVAIQPTTSADYTRIRDEFLQILQSATGSIVRVFSLKAKPNLPENCYSLSFSDCDSTNRFMLDLLEQPLLPNSLIRDIPHTYVFRWDGDLSKPRGNVVEESENIEEDLEQHLSTLKMEGVALHKTKTTIAALAGKKHAVSAIGMVLRSSGYICYSDIAFKPQTGRLDVQLEKITEEDFSKQEKKVYNSQLYWETLWSLWTELVDRYIERTVQTTKS